MAIDNRLQVFNEEGQSVDYDILASDVKFLPDGKDLPTKLAEMQDEIDQAGQGDGTVTGVKVGSDTYEPTEGVVDLSTPFSGKVDKVNGKGLSTNDYTDADKTKLQNLPTADQLTQQMGTKANDNAVVKSISVNGTQQSKDSSGNVAISGLATTEALAQGLGGKQNTLTFDDAPTAGSNNPVKSGGIKTAIDQVTPTINENGKWVIGGVTTDKDAQGPRGNTVLVNENAQGIQALIVNNVVDGGETDILSAEMGKVIRQNIMRIFNALGTYAFTEGKPTLNWGSTVINHSINVNGVTGGLTISDVEVDGVSVGSLPAQVVEGKSLSLKLNLPVGMDMFDGVAITMGGVNITSHTGVWDESTGTIYISSVNDDIAITASAADSVFLYAKQENLIFQLDGLRKGATSGKWTDLKQGIVWDNHGATELPNCWQFDGTTWLSCSNMPTYDPYDGYTIEVCLDSALTRTEYFVFVGGGAKMILNYLSQYGSTNPKDEWVFAGSASPSGSNFAGALSRSMYNGTGQTDNGYGIRIISAAGGTVKDSNAGVINGDTVYNITNYNTASNNPTIGGRIGLTSGNLSKAFTGKVYAIRIYNTKLSVEEMKANQRLDNERFNLGLTIN